MDLNASTSSIADSSLPQELTSFNSSITLHTNECFMSKDGLFVFAATSIINFFILLLIFLVLYLGYQQWRQQSSTSRETSHSDAFLYNSLAIDLNSFLGYTIFFCGGYFNLLDMMIVGASVWNVAFCGQAYLHLLTCVERYLAVVKPITYHTLRQAGLSRIRNISIGCVWLLSLICLIINYLCSYELVMTMYFCILGFSLIVVSFCSISVLCALKRPGPGDAGVKRGQVDQSKQRAFYTMLVIMGTLLFRFGGNLITTITQISTELKPDESCLLSLWIFWFDLPSILLLPLLFLQRARKLQHCK